VVMLHGFPDYWYTWRHQMEELSKQYRTVAIDLRGYNMSDKPKGVENYDMKLLVGDVVAVIKHLGQQKAVVVGHDWGGAIAWNVALAAPEVVDRLVILNLPHPVGLMRELADNSKQRENSGYARAFQQEGSHKKLSAEALAQWVKDPDAQKKYIEAFKKSDFEAMMAYYQRNYPREPYAKIPENVMPKIKMPVLMIHGLGDQALLAGALSGTWDWLDKDLTLVTIPGADHFVQQDAADLVTRSIKMWLNR
ncbi:MAG TPA: alpha/beta hydrolase, partial [Bryobacteraceae bacterium]|nr:alpha/beta hydrolase [Bryobacteraceae bacterium]